MRSRHVLVRSLWTSFDATNCAETMQGFEDLLKRESDSFLIDLRRLRCCVEFWPIFMSPLNPRHQETWDRHSHRWSLVGLSEKIVHLWHLLGLGSFLRIVDSCPDAGGALDLDRGTCACCGPFRVIEWGPARGG